MTAQELQDTYMFRIIRRGLIKEYPWILNVELDDEDFDDYSYTNFLILTIDPDILSEQYGWTIAPWVEREINNNGQYEGTTLGMFFKGREDFGEVTDDVEDTVHKIVNSPAIPEELRLNIPKNAFGLTGFKLR